LIGYARISTDDQHLGLQRDALANAGCERVFEDTASGAKAERTGLTALLATLRRGDTVVSWRLDRLGRSLKDLIYLVERLDTAGVGLRIPTQGEKRERDLRELVRKNKRPVALFVDEAHDLNGSTSRA
jgi:DNA invertase Pin-like site-specific DNA recombinase